MTTLRLEQTKLKKAALRQSIIDLLDCSLSSFLEGGWRRWFWVQNQKLGHKILCPGYMVHVKRIADSYMRNPERITALIKAACHDLRTFGLYGEAHKVSVGMYLIPKFARWHLLYSRKRYKIALQMSMIGRALPPIDTIERSRVAVQQLKDSMEEPFPHGLLPLGFKETLEKVLTKWNEEYEGSTPRVVPFSPGACIGYTRKSGGFSAYLQSRGQGSNLLARLSVAFPTESRVHVIHEQGGKIRPLTSSQGNFLMESHQDRVHTYPALKHIRATAVPLREGGMMFIIPRVAFTGKVLLISADLSNATNLMSHEMISAVCEGTETSDCFVKSHKATYIPREGERIEINPVRGTFMGLPPSWNVLSIGHATICYMVDPSGKTFYLKGDDLIALWTQDQWDHYNSLMGDCGFKINGPKTFISEVKSKGILPLGWFCEKPYRLTYREMRKDKILFDLVEQQDVISLRFITKRASDTRSPTPAWLAGAERYVQVLPHIGSSMALRLRKTMIRLVPRSVLSRCRDPQLPAALGGLSLPKSFDKPLPTISLSAYRQIHNGIKTPLSAYSYRLRSPLSERVFQEHKHVLTVPLKHYKSEGRTILDPRNLSGIISGTTEYYFLQGVSTVPIKGKGPKPDRIYQKFWHGMRSATELGSATYRDAYNLTKRLGIDSESIKSPDGVRWRGQGRLLATDPMKGPHDGIFSIITA
jgi:hypothetical protein